MEGINRTKLLEDKKIWYNKIFVLFEIVKSLQDREVCFITKKDDPQKKMVRYLKAFKVDYLKRHFDWINFSTHLANMYQSVAKLEDIPTFSYDMRVRTQETNYKKFNEDYINHVIGYDLFLDFDGKEDFETCHREAQEMKKIFDENKIPYWIMNSSSNGFHFHIPAEYMPEMEVKENIAYLNNFLYNIKGIYDLKTLDETVIDLKRICKVPYSFVNDGTVCLPLNDTQFEMFNKESVKAMTVLRNITLKNRGLLLRKHNLTDEQLKDNVKTFLEEFK